ncbi:methyltransferase domain-containing protein [Aurantiacibacter atlanticus]|nr:methyltransferase domain-containing protein [Aurantiacibacter atlanticus]
MNVKERDLIGAAFGSASDYDRNARFQHDVACDLATRISALDLPPNPRILEIGCGTGFLTQALIAAGVGGEWLVTDIAPGMIERCKARLGETPKRRFAVLDGEYGLPERGSFDLVCSNLAMQWFDNQDLSIGRMLNSLRPGGHCLFTTLGAGTFAEWAEAHAAQGLKVGTRRFASLAELEALHVRTRVGDLIVQKHVEQHENALAFLRSLRAIGAGTPQSTHRPLGPAEMRRVMARFEDQGAAVTYEVVFGHFRRSLA